MSVLSKVNTLDKEVDFLLKEIENVTNKNFAKGVQEKFDSKYNIYNSVRYIEILKDILRAIKVFEVENLNLGRKK